MSTPATETRTVRTRARAVADADAAAGRAARARAPRKRTGDWDPAVRTDSALSRLQAQEAIRDPELLPLRYARMASSPWAYLRGAAAVMAADLATAPHSGLTVQLCGDAHLLNFGLWASPERQLLFDARDFDETLPGPFEWDVKRLATSIVVLAEAEGLGATTAEAGVDAMVDEYLAAMKRYSRTGELEIWYDRITADMNLSRLRSDEAEFAGRLIRKAGAKRTHAGVARSMTTMVDGRRQIVEDPPRRVHFTLGDEEEISVYEQVFDTYLQSIPPHLIRLVSRFRRADTVRQVVGVGSVGMRVWLHLMEGDSGVEPVFFQIKQATASVYEEFLGPSEFDNHGQRVVVGQRLMQSASDVFLGHVRVDEHDYYVRQFRDMKIIPSGAEIRGFLPTFAGFCGRALAKSHARSGDPAAIQGYLGNGASFRKAMRRYGFAYAAQTNRDHADLVRAAHDGQVRVADRPW